MQEAEKEEIKAWLKRTNREREWLGEQVGVAKRTVDNWLSSPKEIPTGKLNLIQRLMQEDQAREAARRLALLPQSQIFSLEVDLPTFRAYSAAAKADGKTLEEWSIDELNAAAEAAAQTPKPSVTYTDAPHPHAKAAEEPSPSPAAQRKPA